jgi:hypothetical protein
MIYDATIFGFYVYRKTIKNKNSLISVKVNGKMMLECCQRCVNVRFTGPTVEACDVINHHYGDGKLIKNAVVAPIASGAFN